MSWMRWNNKTRRMFIIIVSLLFVLQTATTFGLAKTEDDQFNDLSDFLGGLMKNVIDDSKNSTDDGTTNEEEETPTTSNTESPTTDSTSPSEQNDESSSSVAEEQNTEPEISLADKYLEVISEYQTNQENIVECPPTVTAGGEFKIIVSSNEPAKVYFMGYYYPINENGEASIRALEIAKDANLPVTVVGSGGNSYTKLIYIESGEEPEEGVPDDGKTSNPQFQLLLQKIMWFRNRYFSNFFFSNSEN